MVKHTNIKQTLYSKQAYIEIFQATLHIPLVLLFSCKRHTHHCHHHRPFTYESPTETVTFFSSSVNLL